MRGLATGSKKKKGTTTDQSWHPADTEREYEEPLQGD